MARLKYWVWLSCITNVRPWAKYHLCEALGGPEKVYFAGLDELSFVPGVTQAEAKRLMDKSMEKADHAIEFCQARGIEILTLQDAKYPDRLRNIPDPPVVLYIWGRLPVVDEELLLAVVGTRKASFYGLKMAGKIGRELSQGGAVVVSGLAAGCDAAAMEAALLAGGTVIGVLGTTIDKVYPAQNRRLFDEVKVRGALVSEYAPGTRTYASDFTARNRIITGLSLGVVVAEAPAHSGTRATVNHALDQGRDVFAVPENADAASAVGCNDLIAAGAYVATCGADVLAQYGGRFTLFPPEKSSTHIKKEIDKPEDIVYIGLTEAEEKLPTAQRTVLAVMTRRPMRADEIIDAAGVPAQEVLAALTMLQVTGYVTQGADRRYARKL